MARGGGGGGSGGGRGFGGSRGGSGGSRGFGGSRGGGRTPSRPAGGINRGYTPPRPSIHVHAPRSPVFVGGGWGRSRRMGPMRPGGGGGCGCSSVFGAMFFVFFLVLMFIILTQSFSPSLSANDVTRSTVERKALPSGSVTETPYYTDELGWIGSPNTLTAGMKNFYAKTGVQPHLYITDTINGSHYPTAKEAEAFAEVKYNELFKDDAHLLLIFFEYEESNYAVAYWNGRQARTVLDSEAMDILLDCIDLYYPQNMTDEQFFSKAFDEAGNRIMKVEKSPWIPVLIVAIILGLVLLLFFWWKKAKEQKNREAEQTEQILNMNLESFGDQEAEERAKKYEDEE